MTIDAPVLKGQLSGDLILGTPRPGQLLRLFMVVRGSGVLMKYPGEVQLDQRTGRLTASFDEMPQLPFEDLRIEFKGGPRAVFVTPGDCGTYVTHAELTSWASDAPIVSDSSFTLDRECGKRQRFTPTIEAGTVDSSAGSSSPFLFRLVGQDGQDNVSAIDVTLPGGVLAKLVEGATLWRCRRRRRQLPGQQPGRDGHADRRRRRRQPALRSPAGPTANRRVPGRALPGAPYSLVVDVPAEAGPFDLGAVTVRSGLFVDPVTAQTTINSDPLPQIIEGVPIS